MYEQILVPIDDGDTSARGLVEAMRLADALGSRLRVIHVITRTPAMAPERAGPTADDLDQQL
ncbi:MAG: universal stress protein, partial [Steroidobacteraceae bacterium]